LTGIGRPVIRALRSVAAEIVLRLPEDSPLRADVEGGEVVSLNIDGSIFPVVAQGFDWHFQDTRAELSGLDPAAEYHLIDIGANVGLFCRQVLANFSNVTSASCYEPSPLNTGHLARNLAGFRDVRVLPFGLHRDEGELKFYLDARNGGNFSFNAEAVANRPFTEVTAPVRRITPELLRAHMPGAGAGRRLIWKSDTQGLDEVLMAEMPPAFWTDVDVALFEGWRIGKPAFDHDAFRAMLDAFPHAYRRRRGRMQRVEPGDIVAYLAADDRKWTDFCLSRRPLALDAAADHSAKCGPS